MHNLSEELLDSWIRLSLTIMNEKVVSDLPYNEALLCNILYRQQREDVDKLLTATDLCEMTRMQKSQMNHTLSSMEQRGLITRERSSADTRQSFIRLCANSDSLYQMQHAKTLAIAGEIIARLGEEQTRHIIETFDVIIGAAGEVLKK